MNLNQLKKSKHHQWDTPQFKIYWRKAVELLYIVYAGDILFYLFY